MKRLLLLAFFISCGLSAQNKQTSNLAEAWTSHLLHLEADPNQVASITDFTFNRDAGKFNIKNGKIYLTKPFQDKVIAALFIGDGTFSMTPPTQIERDHLARFYKTQSLEKKFTSLFLVFNDSTYEELTRSTVYKAEEIPSEINEYLKVYANYYADIEFEYISSGHQELLSGILNNDPIFFSGFSNKSVGSLTGAISPFSKNSWSSDPLFFEINPYVIEPVELSRRDLDDKFHHSTEIISKFQSTDNGTLFFLKKIQVQNGRIIHYKIDSQFSDKLKLNAVAEMDIQPTRQNVSWLFFDLYYKLAVDSVFLNEKRVAFLKPYEDSQVWDDSYDRFTLWLETDEKFKSGNTSKLKIYYHGEIIERSGNFLYLRNSIFWYPNNYFTDLHLSTFDLRFSYPSIYKFASIGEFQDEKKQGKITTSHWTLNTPGRNASFNIGFFIPYKPKAKDVPEVTVLIHEQGQGFFAGQSFAEQVGNDVINSLSFLQTKLGKLPIKSLYVSESAYAVHGEAFPGHIHLGRFSFRGTDDEGIISAYRAHEVSHQWWAIGLDYSTYHDKWLSEAFAEYFGLWYMQSVIQDNKKFFQMLKWYQEDIINNRNSLFEKIIGEDQQAGPIWLGYRTSTSSTQGDATLLIYEKGAWVLHMLRNLMLDLNTMSDVKFETMTKDFFQSYSGKKARTEDFKYVVEKHMGADMSWFFDQWIYGTDIPKYIFSYRVIPTKEGKFKVYCRVEQKNVPDNFQMYVPIAIDFGDNRSARMRLLVKGPLTQTELPLLPLEPKKIVFNYLESVLCEVEVDNALWK